MATSPLTASYLALLVVQQHVLKENNRVVTADCLQLNKRELVVHLCMQTAPSPLENMVLGMMSCLTSTAGSEG